MMTTLQHYELYYDAYNTVLTHSTNNEAHNAAVYNKPETYAHNEAHNENPMHIMKHIMRHIIADDKADDKTKQMQHIFSDLVRSQHAAGWCSQSHYIAVGANAHPASDDA